MQEDFPRVQGKLSNSAGSRTRKEVGGSSSPTTSKQRHYITLESRIRGAGSAAEPPPRPRASDYLEAPVRYTECLEEVALGSVPPAAGAGSMFAAQRGLWVRPNPLLPCLLPNPNLLGPLEDKLGERESPFPALPPPPEVQAPDPEGSSRPEWGPGVGRGGRTHRTEISRCPGS